MNDLKLVSDFSLDTILLSNVYIDEYMPANNESQVKIYLYLLRNLSAGHSVSVASIADAFNYSVLDVERALRFMQGQGLMKLDEMNGSIVGLRLLPLYKKPVQTVQPVQTELLSLPKRTEYIPEIPEVKPETVYQTETAYISEPSKTNKSGLGRAMENKMKPELQQLLFVAEQYVGKTLSASDVDCLMNIYEKLGFNEDVVEYLVEYCVSLKKKSFSYIADVAADWADCGVKTLSDAKALTGSCPKEVYDVFKAFGIKTGSRKPVYSEVWFVNKWTGEYGFSIDVIKRACEITLDKTNCVSFEYANGILTNWHNQGVKTVEDIEKSTAWNKKLIQGSKAAYNKVTEAKASKAKAPKKNAFYFENQREYDYDEVERILLRK